MPGDSATAAQRENTVVVSWALSNFPDTFLALPSCKTMTFVEVKLKDFFNDINISGSRKLLLIGKRDKGLGQSENLYAYCMSCYSSGPANNIHFATESMGKYTETRSSIIDVFENHLCDPFHASYDGHSPSRRYEVRSIVALARYYFILTGHISWDGGKSLSEGDFELACNRVARNSGHLEELSTPFPPRPIAYSNSTPNTTRKMIVDKQATQKGKQGSKKRKLDGMTQLNSPIHACLKSLTMTQKFAKPQTRVDSLSEIFKKMTNLTAQKSSLWMTTLSQTPIQTMETTAA